MESPKATLRSHMEGPLNRATGNWQSQGLCMGLCGGTSEGLLGL